MEPGIEHAAVYLLYCECPPDFARNIRQFCQKLKPIPIADRRGSFAIGPETLTIEPTGPLIESATGRNAWLTKYFPS